MKEMVGGKPPSKIPPDPFLNVFPRDDDGEGKAFESGDREGTEIQSGNKRQRGSPVGRLQEGRIEPKK